MADTVSRSFDAALATARDEIRAAHADGAALRIVGAGTWLHGGRPVLASRTIGTRDLAGVRAYVPGDLVMTVGAGTTLAEIAAITGEHDQLLALDPVGDGTTTIGAAIATASSGPLALGAGRIRDLLLGVTCIDGTGTSIRAGAPVVKNVAGFDLVRLAVGAFGTLGVVAEASLRLHARPAVDRTYALPLPSSDATTGLLARLGTAALSYHALELLNPALASAVFGDSRREWVLLARATGNRNRVTALRALLGDAGHDVAVAETDPRCWSELRRAAATTPDQHGAVVVRVSDRPARLAVTIAAVERALAAAGARARVGATPHTGIVRAVVESTDDGAAGSIVGALQALRTSGARVVFEQLPALAWGSVPGAAHDPISRRIRLAFDPGHLLNRGILGERLPAATGHAVAGDFTGDFAGDIAQEGFR